MIGPVRFGDAGLVFLEDNVEVSASIDYDGMMRLTYFIFTQGVPTTVTVTDSYVDGKTTFFQTAERGLLAVRRAGGCGCR